MKKFLKILFFIFLSLLILLAGGVGYLTLTEYKPADVEKITLAGRSEEKFSLNREYKVLDWNIGFAGLDKDEDFFMDGGTNSLPIDKAHVENNLEKIKNLTIKENPDLVFFQEVDENSKRSFGINQVDYFNKNLQGTAAFAYNYKVKYVPYPFPPLGKINSGIYTNSKYSLENSTRYQLPVPFSYPVRVANLKRAFTASYAKIEGSDKNLVLINVHFEAYDSDNEGKLAQTKKVFEFLEQEYAKGNYIILGADFNQALNDITEEELNSIPENLWRPKKFDLEGLSKNFKLYYDKTKPTARLLNQAYNKNNKGTYTYTIDGFIVSNNVKVKSVQTIDEDFQNSDHNPVVLKFELENQAR
ncbi:endonuclease [Gemella sp. zg-570]|uniref:endonuclease/exonuclease/phosphatase family protein n=1 Tax=Gemella sp. zg-570 TaxID=2840371 RepID=UPI001C0C8924|nr:endonuclease/exonuclease/phosphatase family protein [Gemella sp. zg-570]QWQ38510.1 endonuclease [Gemella sp. zg-570]